MEQMVRKKIRAMIITIEDIRRQLEKLASAKGLKNKEVLDVSQKLDTLMVEYYHTLYELSKYRQHVQQ